MNIDTIKILITMLLYMLVVICIGIYFAKRANQNSEEYFLGGRSLGPWVAAMSAEASDMSGWLLMGLPGVAYWCGFADAFWTALGLGLGTYINWLIISKRLRRSSTVFGNSITLPDYFSNRFHEKKKVIMTISSLFILIFFTVYAASCFVTCGKLFHTLFGFSYHSMMIAGVIFVIIYTILGGFLAESASDFMQSIVMICALTAVLVIATIEAGGPNAVLNNIKKIPGFFEFFGIASPSLKSGAQQIANNLPVFENAKVYGFLTILSTMSWGLGYFGMPQVLLRFMAIRKADELKKSRRIATTWAVISMIAAVCIGLIGRTLYPTALTTQSASENIFILLSSNLLPSIGAGLVMAGILAATISSSDSYLLIAASAFSKNIYQGILKKDATEKQIMNVSRITLAIVALIGVIIALDENSVIFTIVSFAWAGFGATFGPIMIFSLFWKRTNRQGAIAGMLAGGLSVFIWKIYIRPLGGFFDIYELLPSFIISCLFIFIVSLLTKAPEKAIQEDFEKAKTFAC
ncbi:sodium/proline symporter PutP [Anaerosacchariphilus polymeriproducens]|uniref:Sodium/proline symporter n=1 Tax=Anaerosacchariphilus polymeriproducens TaxID=1812858 RepID=A0A371AUC8_9FIRM|nr:sodium/proline symporter PutP [Anaerosacchariphilus polymeriproducens]RDU23149.1 sodium/proline symporter PutP [Anaerosacchariphilus polymeriproducens]